MSTLTVLRLDAASLRREAHLNALIHDLYRELRGRRRVLVSLSSQAETELLISTLDDAGVPVSRLNATDVHALAPGALIDARRTARLFRDAPVLVTQEASQTQVVAGGLQWTPDQQLASAASPLRIVLLGLGTVGLGVYRHLAHRPDLFEVSRIVVREPAKHAYDGVPAALFSTNVWETINQPADLVIELIGGLDPTADVVHAALIRGRSVVTANKLLIASRWPTLKRFAEGPAPRLSYSAAVGGAVPVLENLSVLRQGQAIESVRGIVNGTCNFVLDELERGVSLDSAIAQAQARGFAEADPHADLSGADAAQKLCLLAQAAFGTPLQPAEVDTAGIAHLTAAHVERARAADCRIRLVAECVRDAERVRASVRSALIAPRDFLHGARGEENRIEIKTADGQCVRLRGKGAGRWPTALAVLGDVYEIFRSREAAAPAARAGLNR
jgi:homoserine dehydrogenase